MQSNFHLYSWSQMTGYVFKQLRFCDIVLFFKGISYFICSSNVSAKFYKNPYSRNPKKNVVLILF